MASITTTPFTTIATNQLDNQEVVQTIIITFDNYSVGFGEVTEDTFRLRFYVNEILIPPSDVEMTVKFSLIDEYGPFSRSVVEGWNEFNFTAEGINIIQNAIITLEPKGGGLLDIPQVGDWSGAPEFIPQLLAWEAGTTTIQGVQSITM